MIKKFNNGLDLLQEKTNVKKLKNLMQNVKKSIGNFKQKLI